MSRERPVKGPRVCRTCGEPIRFVREVDSGRTLVLNAAQLEGGTVVLLDERGTAQVVPPGRGLGFTLHGCERGDSAAGPNGSPTPEEAF